MLQVSQAEAKGADPQDRHAAPTMKLKGPTITLNRGKSAKIAPAEQSSPGQEGLTFFGKKVNLQCHSPQSAEKEISFQIGSWAVQRQTTDYKP